MRRCSRGWCCAVTLTPLCSASASSRAVSTGMAEHQQRRHEPVEVVLGDEGLEHLHLGAASRLSAISAAGILDMRREVGPVAEVAAAAHHGQVDAGAAALHLHRQDVDVLVDRAAGCCRPPPAGAARATARRSGCASRPPARTPARSAWAIMRRLQVVEHASRVAAQEALGVGHVARVVVRRDQADAGRRAAPDLVQQARPRAVGEHRVLAGAQAEHLLQQLDRLLHRPGARVRPEVAVLAGRPRRGSRRRAGSVPATSFRYG